MKVKFKKAFSINKIGSIAEFDKELCDKLIDREICVEASSSDVKADGAAKAKIKKEAKANLAKANKRNEATKKLHKAMNLREEKEVIATWSEKQRDKKK